MLQKIKTTLLILLILGIAASAYVYFRNKQNTRIGEKEGRAVVTNNKTLREGNPDFSAALDAVNRGSLEESQKYFASALVKETNLRGQSIIKLNSANAYLRIATSTTDKISGVNMVNILIDDASTPLDIKAYAVQNLSQWYLAIRDEELYNAIFNDPHYNKYKHDDKDESVNDLFVYSLSFYKLSIPLLKTALHDTVILTSSSTLSISDKEEFTKKIPDILSAVDKDTAIVLNGGNPVDTMSIFLARARLLDALEKLTGDKKFGDPVEYFAKAYERAELNHVGITKGHILLHWSSYYFEKGDMENMKKTLDTFVNDGSILSSPFKTFLTKLAIEKDSADDKQLSATLRKIAPLHPGLKKELTNLGWIF